METKNSTYEERRVLEKQQIQKDIQRLNEILKSMGFKINSKHDEFYRAYAHGTNGNKEIYLTANDYRNKDRIVVSGLFPKDSKNNNFYYEVEKTKYSSITISMKKSNGQIINEINKRFMPNYLDALNKVLDRIGQSEKHFNKSNNSIKRVSEILNLEIQEGYLNKVHYWKYEKENKIKSLDVEALSSGEELKIGLRGNTEEVLKILKEVKRFL
jgi:SLT domain-containing protein